MPEQIVGTLSTADQVLAEGNLQALSRRRTAIGHWLSVFDSSERMASRLVGEQCRCRRRSRSASVNSPQSHSEVN